MARTAQVFHQPLSSLLEIGDWSVARELDIAAAKFLIEEEKKREDERDRTNRNFWRQAFGGQPESDDSEDGGTITLVGSKEPN